MAQALPIERQRQIDTILLTHSHMDHTNSLPFFVENVYENGAAEIQIWASEATTYAVRKYLFNNDAWPDFTRLPNNLLPVVRFMELTDEDPVMVKGVRGHDDSSRAPGADLRLSDRERQLRRPLVERYRADVFAFGSWPTKTPNLKGRLSSRRASTTRCRRSPTCRCTLTPHSLRAEVAKLERQIPILIHHMKPPCVDRIRAEVEAIGDSPDRFSRAGQGLRVLADMERPLVKRGWFPRVGR